VLHQNRHVRYDSVLCRSYANHASCAYVSPPAKPVWKYYYL